MAYLNSAFFKNYFCDIKLSVHLLDNSDLHFFSVAIVEPNCKLDKDGSLPIYFTSNLHSSNLLYIRHLLLLMLICFKVVTSYPFLFLEFVY